MDLEDRQQRRIEQLLRMRLDGGFTPEEAAEYILLLEEERKALVLRRHIARPDSRSA